MKKLMAIVGATLMLAGVATSCSKTCECVTTVGGISTTSEVTIKSGKCTDMNAEVTNTGITTKTECKKK